MNKNILLIVALIIIATLLGIIFIDRDSGDNVLVDDAVVNVNDNDNGSVDDDSEIIVTNFEECIAAGNPAMESYPRQCIHEGQHFVEDISGDGIPDEGEPYSESKGTFYCTDEMRNVMCTEQYVPVCALVQVQCITTPCPPLPQTYGNGCSACQDQNILSYTEGECGEL